MSRRISENSASLHIWEAHTHFRKKECVLLSPQTMHSVHHTASRSALPHQRARAAELIAPTQISIV
jgi:hypothetical protein